MVDYYQRDSLVKGLRIKITDHHKYKGYYAVIISTDRYRETVCVYLEAKGIHPNVIIPMRYCEQIFY